MMFKNSFDRIGTYEKNSSVILLAIYFQGASQEHYDLYCHVDSLIVHELKYISDSTTDQLLKYAWDSTKTVHRHFKSFSSNPSPRIILDGVEIDMSGLNKFKMKNMKKIEVYLKEDIVATAIYGQSAKERSNTYHV